jgi:hypothetical protein
MAVREWCVAAVVLLGLAAGVATAASPQFTYEYKAGFVGAGNDVIPCEAAASIQVSQQL